MLNLTQASAIRPSTRVAELIFKDEVYQIVGAAMDVYYTLGRGFLEPVYQEALGIEMRHREITFERRGR